MFLIKRLKSGLKPVEVDRRRN